MAKGTRFNVVRFITKLSYLVISSNRTIEQELKTIILKTIIIVN